MSYGFSGASRGIYQTELEAVRSGKSHRTVMPNAMVAHVWAQQNQRSGRSGNGNFYFEGATIYSYGTHFPVATFLPVKSGNTRLVLFNSAKSSVTTAQHQGDVRSALSGLSDVVTVNVPDLAQWFSLAPSSWMIRSDDAAHRALAKSREERRHRMVFDSLVKSAGESELAARSYEGRTSDGDSWDRDHNASMVRHYRESAESCRSQWAAYARTFKVRRSFPADCAGAVERMRAGEAKERFAAKVRAARDLAESVNAAHPLPGSLSDYMTVPTDPAQFSHGSARWVGERIAAHLKALRSARLTLGKAGASKRLTARLSGAVKAIAALPERWAAFDAEVELFRRRESIIQTVRDAMAGQGDWRFGESQSGSVAARHVADIRRSAAGIGLDSHVLTFLDRQCSLIMWRAECPATFKRPTYTNGSRPQSQDERRADWLAGKRNGFSQETPTLVRRMGSALETSRAAVVPWREALLIFRMAQDCRIHGRTWKRNGATQSVGQFELESIDSSGNIRVGCHFIRWEEMESLAVRECPELVKPRFPVPALVA